MTDLCETPISGVVFAADRLHFAPAKCLEKIHSLWPRGPSFVLLEEPSGAKTVRDSLKGLRPPLEVYMARSAFSSTSANEAFL